jgi:hypothetical protein
VVGVVHFGVAYEMNQCGHVASVWLTRPKTKGIGR